MDAQETKRRREVEEAFEAASMSFASPDERTQAAALCVRCCADTGLAPTELVRRWDAQALNEKRKGPVRLHKLENFLQALRRQAVAATAPSTAFVDRHTHWPRFHHNRQDKDQTESAKARCSEALVTRTKAKTRSTSSSLAPSRAW